MSLPARGTGLRRGIARPRRWPPLTEAQRVERHRRIYGLGSAGSDTAVWVAAGSFIAGALIILGVVLSK